MIISTSFCLMSGNNKKKFIKNKKNKWGSVISSPNKPIN